MVWLVLFLCAVILWLVIGSIRLHRVVEDLIEANHRRIGVMQRVLERVEHQRDEAEARLVRFAKLVRKHAACAVPVQELLDRARKGHEA